MAMAFEGVRFWTVASETSCSLLPATWNVVGGGEYDNRQTDGSCIGISQMATSCTDLHTPNLALSRVVRPKQASFVPRWSLMPWWAPAEGVKKFCFFQVDDATEVRLERSVLMEV